MNQTFKRAMSLFMALAMVLSMVPSFGTHVHAEELETEPVVQTEAPATEAPVVETPVEEVPETEAPTQAPETEAPATEAPEIVETEAPEVTEVVETEAAEETESVEETEEVTPDATEETLPEEFLEEEIVEEEAVAAVIEGSLSDSSISLSLTESAKNLGTPYYWTADGNKVEGVLTSAALGGRQYVSVFSTLTIKNNKTSEATLSFAYAIDTSNGGYVEIDGTQYTTGTSVFEKKLGAGDSVSIKLQTNMQTKINTVSIAITELSLVVAGNPTVTFKPAEFGSYTVNGDAIVSSTSIQNPSSTSYTMIAEVLNGYKFVGWYNETAGKYISREANCTTKFENDCTINPVIVAEDAAIFLVGQGNYFADLDDAVNFAVTNNYTQVTLIESGKIADAEYTIPKGITLLIPKDTAYTPMAANAVYSVEANTPKAFLTLTLAQSTKVIVNGAVEVEAEHTSLQGAGDKRPYGGRVNGAYGAIYMNSGASIILNSDAVLYAWGYVYGNGSVTAESGATVYEYMQVADFPGGGNLTKFVDAAWDVDADSDGNPTNDYIKFFPLSQYYVQNVEVPMTMKAGAVEFVYATITVNVSMSMGMPIEFIGENGMFTPNNGYIVKDYDEDNDRMVVDVNGDASVGGVSLMLDPEMEAAVAGALGMESFSFDSSGYVFGLNGNISINIHSGKTTISQDMALLPGVEITVDRGAVLNLTEHVHDDNDVSNTTVMGTFGHNVYVYDMDQWGKRVFQNVPMIVASYSPTTNRHKRTVDDLKDAEIDINGTVLLDGFLYSTVTLDEDYVAIGGGANIHSSGQTGKIVMQRGAGEEFMAYCLDGSSAKDDFVDIASAWLKNSDGTYLETTGAEVGTTYNYCKVCDKWHEGDACSAPETVEITWIVESVASTQEVEFNTVPTYGLGDIPTKETANCKAYTFAGWKDAAGNEYPIGTALPAATTDATYFAYFTESPAHVDGDKNHDCDNCGTEISKCEYGETEYYWEDDYSGCTAVRTCQYCEESNAHYVDSNVSESPATCVAEGSITYTATFDEEWAETQTKTVAVEVNPANHTGNNHVANGFAATCGKDGYEGDIICECGTKVGEGNPIPATGNHSFTNKPSDKKKDDATCISGATYYVQCDNCDEVDYTQTVAAGEVNPENHVKTHVASEWTRGENNDHFRWRVCDGCESNIAKENVATCVDSDRDGDHNCNLCGRENITRHFGGTANCQSPAICEECKTAYGEVAPDFHAGEVTVSYLNTQEHKITFSCCEGVELIQVHNDETGDDYACDVCGAIQVVVVKLFPAGGNTLWAEAGKDFVYSLSDENYNLLAGAMAAGGAQPVYTVVKKGETGALTIPEISSYHMIQVAPVYIGRVSFNGGTFAHKAMGEMYKSMGLKVTDEDHEAVVPVGSGTSYTEDNYSRDGWTLVGYKVNGTEYPVGESYAVAADGFVVDLIWKCAGHVYDNECDVDCNKCGETREVADHVSDAAYPCLPGKCVNCGADVAASVNHSFTKYVSNEDASCTVDGNETAKCDYNCGASDTRVAVGSQLGHIDTDTDHKCDRDCGKTDMGTHADSATDNDHVCDYGCGAVLEKCSDKTGDKDHKCDVCGEPDVTGHTGGTATCMAAAKCEECSQSYGEKDASNHTKKNTTVKDAKAATCGEDGYTGDTYCECGEKIADGKTIPATGEHSDKTGDGDHECDVCGEPDVTGHTGGTATCMAAAKCAECEQSYGEKDASNHTKQNTTVKGAVEATCGEDGYTGDTYCECGEKIADGETIPATGEHSDKTGDGDHKCDVCGEPDVTGHTGGTATCMAAAVCEECGKSYGNMNPENHVSDKVNYTNNGETHSATHDCCGTDYVTNENHTFVNGECVCEAKQTFTLTVSVSATGDEVKLTVPYGANLLDVLDQAVADEKIPAIGKIIRHDTWEDIVIAYSYQDENGKWIYDLEGLTMPADDFAIDQNSEVYRGWQDYGVGTAYIAENDWLKGWNNIEDDFDGVEGGAWYYFQEGTGEWEGYFFRVEGISRVPYPTEAIYGVTYAPDQESIEYAASKGETFIDAEEGWFIFDEAGKFQSTETGMGTYLGETRYAENGHIAWHPGMIAVGEDYYYFIGDVTNGGNIMATGDVHISRDNSGFGAVKSGVYTFGEDGKLCKYDGITDMADGSKRYYENAQLMIGKGLVKIDENYIYVRSNGELVVNGKYWIGQNEFELVQGMYDFDENGFLVNPVSTEKDGVHAEDGGLYYYENGKRTYAGLIEFEGNIIYVTSSGKLATGKYWVTKTNDMEGYAAGFYFFDEEGRMMANRNGIVSGKDASGNDVLYYYINNEIAYAAGLIKLEDGYIYVKSNGQLATGLYWITKTNDLLPAAKYEFDENGYMITDVTLDGVVAENDALYYYIKGIKQYGLGLVEIGGKYIYVRTNGELATGTYWITRTNDLKEAGKYEFGTDGYMIVEN